MKMIYILLVALFLTAHSVWATPSQSRECPKMTMEASIGSAILRYGVTTTGRAAAPGVGWYRFWAIVAACNALYPNDEEAFYECLAAHLGIL